MDQELNFFGQFSIHVPHGLGKNSKFFLVFNILQPLIKLDLIRLDRVLLWDVCINVEKLFRSRRRRHFAMFLVLHRFLKQLEIEIEADGIDKTCLLWAKNVARAANHEVALSNFVS